MSWVKGDGAKIKLVFTQNLVGDVAGNQAAFTITVPEYTYVPGGVIINVVKAVLSTYAGDSPKELILEMQPLQRFESAVGDITVAYSGTGTLVGQGGPVAAFSQAFTPLELTPKPDQNNQENVEISAVMPNIILTSITHSNTQAGAENIEVSGCIPTVTLTHINDL